MFFEKKEKEEFLCTAAEWQCRFNVSHLTLHNPHGSDVTYPPIPPIPVFLTHTVQMELVVMIEMTNKSYSFLTHTVQMEPGEVLDIDNGKALSNPHGSDVTHHYLIQYLPF